jgi:hypothetical protein
MCRFACTARLTVGVVLQEQEIEIGDHLAAQKMAQRYADTYPESELQIPPDS